MPKDPVCKMDISRDDAESSAQYKGREYYFCSEECRETFEKEPEKYSEKGKRVA